jgi:dihydrofolate reductase
MTQPQTSPGTGRPFSGAVFVATSLDGYIARPDGRIDWLISAAEEAGDTGYEQFIAGIDSVVMGRKTYEQARTFDSWPHEGRRVAVLSTRLPVGIDQRISVHRTIFELVEALTAFGAARVYVDGGQVIQTFLAEGLIQELTVTTVPLLLGRGLPLFGQLPHDVTLMHRQTRVLGAGLVQSSYTTSESS